MKKLFIICLLALTFTNTYSQYDETYSNDWGSWENCSDFKDIKFRIKSNYVKGQKFRFVDIQFRNEYETGVYFYFFAKDLLGNENTITNQGHWKIFKLNKGESKEANSVKMNYDEESLDIYIGGVYFSRTSKSEPPELNSKLSYTYPDINNNSEEKDLCLYCTLFKDKPSCPQGKNADVSNPWSASGTATLGRKISRAEANNPKATLDAQSTTIHTQNINDLSNAVSVIIQSEHNLKVQERRLLEKLNNSPNLSSEALEYYDKYKKFKKRSRALLYGGLGVTGVGLGLILLGTSNLNFGLLDAGLGVTIGGSGVMLLGIPATIRSSNNFKKADSYTSVQLNSNGVSLAIHF